MVDPIKKARRIIESTFYMTIATASFEKKPWISPVYYALDDSYTFFWYSRKQTKHSQLITENNQVAIAIFNSNASEDEVGGVYLEGRAYEVAEDELHHAIEIYFTRSLPNDLVQRQKMVDTPQDFLEESVLRMYKFVPERVYVSGEATKWNGKWIDSRIEVQLIERK